MNQTQGNETAGRVADVLLLFLDGPEVMGVSMIARELGLSKAVVHRTLTTLVPKGLLARDPVSRGYVLGPTAASLGARALRGSDLRSAAEPIMRRLHRTTLETVTVSALVPGGRVYLAQLDSPQEIKMTVELGRRFPLHAGSSGISILAFLDPRDREDYLDDLFTPAERLRSGLDREALTLRLNQVRRDGGAGSEAERQAGTGAVAAPVFGFDGRPVGALSVCGPSFRLDAAVRARLLPDVVAAAAEVSRRLGWPGHRSAPTGAPRDTDHTRSTGPVGPERAAVPAL